MTHRLKSHVCGSPIDSDQRRNISTNPARHLIPRNISGPRSTADFGLRLRFHRRQRHCPGRGFHSLAQEFSKQENNSADLCRVQYLLSIRTIRDHLEDTAVTVVGLCIFFYDCNPLRVLYNYPSSMRAPGIRDGKGSADALFIEYGVPDPHPEKDQIIIRIKAFGLNRMDIMQREGRYPYNLLPESGNIMGVEFSGLIEQLGPDCIGDIKVGHEAFGLAYGGAYAEKICVSESMLMLMPSNLSFEEAAGVPETFFTAIQAVHLVGDMQPGQTVLIHAGASGVGQSAIQVAKVAGASKIFTTAGTDEKCELCKSLEAGFAINYRTSDFVEVIQEVTNGRGVDFIVDLVGRDYWHKNIRVAAMDSRIVIVALMSGSQIDNFNMRDLLNKRICLMTTTLRTRNAEYQRRLRDSFVEKMMPHLASGKVKAVVDKVYDWTEVSNAHKRMESNVNTGKIICVVNSDKTT